MKCPVMASGAIEGVGCVVPEKLKCTLQKYYSYTQFRPGQLESLLAIAHGKDVFVKLATGSGKSLCMFLLASCYQQYCNGYHYQSTEWIDG